MSPDVQLSNAVLSNGMRSAGMDPRPRRQRGDGCGSGSSLELRAARQKTRLEGHSMLWIGSSRREQGHFPSRPMSHRALITITCSLFDVAEEAALRGRQEVRWRVGAGWNMLLPVSLAVPGAGLRCAVVPLTVIAALRNARARTSRRASVMQRCGGQRGRRHAQWMESTGRERCMTACGWDRRLHGARRPWLWPWLWLWPQP